MKSFSQFEPHDTGDPGLKGNRERLTVKDKSSGLPWK